MKQFLLFSKEDCTPCKMVKQLLNSEGVDYKEVDVISNTNKASDYGVMSVPVLISIDGEEEELDRSVGFDVPKIKNMIN